VNGPDIIRFGGLPVPWNASWTGEAEYAVRPCRWADGQLAMWMAHRPGIGRPIFAKPHFVRQRKSIARWLCTVCGQQTPANDRWWFGHGTHIDGMYMTGEAPVHKLCAEFSLLHCPHLKGRENDLARFPDGYSIVASVLAPSINEEFGTNVQEGQRVVGTLKFAWPRSRIRFRGEAA
jgi:hypothetical protein